MATAAALDRMGKRIGGLRAGASDAVDHVQVFGSRDGSTFRGRGPRPDSDIDIFVEGSFGLSGGRHQKAIETKLKAIAKDFTDETGIPVQLVPDWRLSVQRAGEILSSSKPVDLPIR